MKKHAPFKTRPAYKTSLTLTEYRQNALNGRKSGFYNLTTLWFYKKAWQTSKKLSDYLLYLSFRRDLGYSLTANQKARLISWHTNSIAKLFFRLTERQSYALKKKLLKKQSPKLDELAAFVQYLNEASNIQIVGNSGSLINSNLGNQIDLADIVTRFNLSFSSETQTKDTGKKTDIWVCAPDFKYKAPKAKWYIIAGPDMLNWISRLPNALENKTPVLSIPLKFWRNLVREMGAPPSAGILTISWLIELAPNIKKQTLGFGNYTKHTQHTYHHADKKHCPVQRHNWHYEQKLLEKWQQQNFFHNSCKDRTE